MPPQPPMSDDDRDAARRRHGFAPAAARAGIGDLVAATTVGPALAAMNDRGELDTLTVAEARDGAWRVVIDTLDTAPEPGTHGTAVELAHAVKAWQTLRAVAGQADDRIDEVARSLERAHAELAVVTRHRDELLRIADRIALAGGALGADAFEGRYQNLGQAIEELAPFLNVQAPPFEASR